MLNVQWCCVPWLSMFSVVCSKGSEVTEVVLRSLVDAYLKNALSSSSLSAS